MEQTTTKKEVKVIRPTIEHTRDARIIRMAGYCRVSTDSDDQADSFLAQVKYYNDFIHERDDMELVDIYADEGITGTCMKKRDEFNRMMHDAKVGKIDRILTKSVSRFARNSLECLEAIRELASYGVSVLFENDNIDTKTMNSEMILYVKSAFAQSEALAGSKRVATAYRMKMESGKFLTYSAPYGYRLEGQTLIPIPEQAEIVKRIFAEYLSGKGTSKIAGLLNSEGLLHNGTDWAREDVRYILTNEKYIGDCMVQKSFTPPILPLRNRPNRGEREKFYIEHTHEAIISTEDYKTVQRLMKENASDNFKKGQQYLLSGMIRCQNCGWAYKRREQRGITYWVCSHRNMAGFQCNGMNLPEEGIYRAFIRMYNRLRQYEKEIIDATLSQLSQMRIKLVSSSNEISQIDIEISELCKQNDMYAKLRQKEIMDEISYMEQSAVLQKRITELRSRRLKLINENEDERCIEELRELKELLSELPPVLIDFDDAVFEALVKGILAGNDGTVIFEIKGGLKLRERAVI